MYVCMYVCMHGMVCMHLCRYVCLVRICTEHVYVCIHKQIINRYTHVQIFSGRNICRCLVFRSGRRSATRPRKAGTSAACETVPVRLWRILSLFPDFQQSASFNGDWTPQTKREGIPPPCLKRFGASANSFSSSDSTALLLQWLRKEESRCQGQGLLTSRNQRRASQIYMVRAFPSS